MLNMRHLDARTKGRAVAVSHDGGLSFGNITYDPALVSPICEASIVSFSNKVYFSNPADSQRRVNLTIRESRDNGQTWPASLLVREREGGGYSCLVPGELVHASGYGGIVFEGAGVEFAQFPLDLEGSG